MSNEIIVRFLVEMTELMKSAKDFTMQQLPLVAQEILKYNLAINCIWFLFPLCGLILCLLFYKTYNKSKKLINEFNEVPTPDYMSAKDKDWNRYRELENLNTKNEEIKNSSLVGIFVVGFCSVLIILHISSPILKIVLAPRIYLIEYTSKLVSEIKDKK